MNDIPLVQRLLHGAEREEYAFLGPSADIDARSSLLRDAYHLVVNPVYPDIFPAGITSLEQYLVHLSADQAKLTFLDLVDLV